MKIVSKRKEKFFAKFCAIVILADEDPRGENPVELLKEIAAGAEKAGKVLEDMKELLLSFPS